MYTISLAPADFSGAVFTCAHFKKLPLIFLLHKWRNSFTHAFLVTNGHVLGIWLLRIYARPKKTRANDQVYRALTSVQIDRFHQNSTKLTRTQKMRMFNWFLLIPIKISSLFIDNEKGSNFCQLVTHQFQQHQNVL